MAVLLDQSRIFKKYSYLDPKKASSLPHPPTLETVVLGRLNVCLRLCLIGRWKGWLRVWEVKLKKKILLVFTEAGQRNPRDIFWSLLITIPKNLIPIQTKIIGEDSLAACAPICWLTAKRQHCLFNMRKVRGHCIAFVRSAVEVTLSSGPSCCRQLGHATYIESHYPCQLITTQLVPSHNTPKRTHAHRHNTMNALLRACTLAPSLVDPRGLWKAESGRWQSKVQSRTVCVSRLKKKKEKKTAL